MGGGIGGVAVRGIGSIAVGGVGVAGSIRVGGNGVVYNNLLPSLVGIDS